MTLSFSGSVNVATFIDFLIGGFRSKSQNHGMKAYNSTISDASNPLIGIQ